MNHMSRRMLIATVIVAILGAGVATSVLRPWHGGEAQANTPPPAPAVEVASAVGQTITGMSSRAVSKPWTAWKSVRAFPARSKRCISAKARS